MNTQYPLARKAKLVVRELAEEVLVYDLDRKKASCLNRIAGAVWKLSDGQTPVSKIAEELSVDFGATIEERVVWVAVDQLGRDHLLEYCIPTPSSVSGLTRREQLRSLGKAAAIVGPLVATLAVPRSAAAQSCAGAGQSCLFTRCCAGDTACNFSTGKCNGSASTSRSKSGR